MKVIYEDRVDWEPLRIRFRMTGTPSQDQRDSLAAFMLDWMRRREIESPEKWCFCKCYGAVALPSGEVEAGGELFPSDEVAPLAAAVAANFDFVAEMRLGEPLQSSPTLKTIDWFDVPSRRVTIDGEDFDVDAFTISFTAVTAGQFCEFLDATGWQPVPDKLRFDAGFTISYFELNYGPSPKVPLFGLTYDDAAAFCDWSGYRLPTDPELRLFYEAVAAQTLRNHDWGGENWTSTPAGDDQFYVRHGPLAGLPAGDPDQYRKPAHRHHYMQLEAPCFRIVKP